MYDFCGKLPCANEPKGPVVFDASGALYGTAYAGGGGQGGSCYTLGCGAVYKLTPSGSSYVESLPYSFCEKAACSDGSQPSGPLTFDAQGSIYGTATSGGKNNAGVVFELTPFASGYKERVLYSFCPSVSTHNLCKDGQAPDAGVILGKHGALYGTASGGSSNCQQGCGIAFKLTPSGKKYTESVIYTFCKETGCNDGAEPNGALIIDKAGVLYGTTGSGGDYRHGTVFSLTPSKGSYAERVLYSFCQAAQCTDGAAPNSLIFGQGGALFGTTQTGGFADCDYFHTGCGTVFTLTPSTKTYKERVLHAFCHGEYQCNDGEIPIGVVSGKSGLLYGAAFSGGLYYDQGSGCGTIFKLVSTRPHHYEYRLLYDVGADSHSDSCWPNSTPVLRDDGALLGTSVGFIDIHYGSTGTVWELQPEH